MWYMFKLYEDEGDMVQPTDVTLIQARNVPEAWEKASDYAYDHGFCDFDLVEITE